MSFEKTRFPDYYVLNKDTFSIDPLRDSAAYFGSAKLSEAIRARIEGDFAHARAVPKFFVHGAYGSGKTHTLFHISHWLRSNELESVEPIYIDIAPLRNKEKFASVQGRLLDAIGLDRIADAAERYATEIQGDKATGIRDSLIYGDAALMSSQANVFRNILFGGRQPSDFIYVLLNTAVLFRLGIKKKLVFLIDEAEAFRDVQDPDSEAEFTFAFRQLIDDSNKDLGIVCGIQPEGGQGELGSFFLNPAIERRIGFQTGYFDLVSLISQELDVRRFTDELLVYLVNQEKAARIVADERLPCKSHHFPFEESALERMASHIANDIAQQTPAGIIHSLATAAIDAWRSRGTSESHVTVDGELMERVLYPER
jgi:hypothetical protein